MSSETLRKKLKYFVTQFLYLDTWGNKGSFFKGLFEMMRYSRQDLTHTRPEVSCH